MADSPATLHSFPWVYVGGGVATRDLPGHLVRTETEVLPELVEPQVAEQMQNANEEVRLSETDLRNMGKKV